MNVCDYIINELYENGITTYFVVTGGAIVPFINSIEKHQGAQYYCFQHEQSAPMAAGRAKPMDELPKFVNNFCPGFNFADCIVHTRFPP